MSKALRACFHLWVTPKLDSYAEAVDAMLVAELDAPRKQLHTARRVHARLLDEHDARVS